MKASNPAGGSEIRPGRIILLDEPYVSEYMQSSIAELEIPVFATGSATLNEALQARLIDAGEAKRLIETPGMLVYMNSENSLDFLCRSFGPGDRADAIRGLKDKHRFRELIRSVFPEMQFQEVSLGQLGEIDPAELRFPLVLKPSVGFFSAGVHIVHEISDWSGSVARLTEELAEVGDQYPESVLNIDRILIEDYIDGEEYAIDAYFNEQGEPVILNIMRHVFRDERDILDVLYLTNRKLVTQFQSDAKDLLRKIGGLLKLTSFPLHTEVRQTSDGRLVPIEANPYRFAGWCTTDLAHYAHGVDVYASYFNGLKPSWDAPGEGTGTYGFVIMHPPVGTQFDPEAEIDLEALHALLGDVRELRLVDRERWGILGIAFVQFESEEEAERIVHVDFRLALRASSENGSPAGS